MKLKTLFLTSLLSTTVAFGNVKVDNSQLFIDAKNWINTIDEKEVFPLEKLHYVKSQNKTFLVSGNGHYAIFGDIKIVDVWNRKVINSADDLKKSNRVAMGIFKAQAKDLMSTVKYGRGKKEVYIFTNAKSPYSAKLNLQVAELGDMYTFYFINVAALKGSSNVSKKLECNENHLSAKAIIFNDYKILKDITKCEGVKEKLQASLLLSRVIGINRVPAIVSSNGTLHQGFIKDLGQFLGLNND